ncbi:hypothetical protein QYF36_015268 [Acer negundo]|nr:hypothetical protein QYF36_015268 [Acer negundo]
MKCQTFLHINTIGINGMSTGKKDKVGKRGDFLAVNRVLGYGARLLLGNDVIDKGKRKWVSLVMVYPTKKPHHQGHGTFEPSLENGIYSSYEITMETDHNVEEVCLSDIAATKEETVCATVALKKEYVSEVEDGQMGINSGTFSLEEEMRLKDRLALEDEIVRAVIAGNGLKLPGYASRKKGQNKGGSSFVEVVKGDQSKVVDRGNEPKEDFRALVLDWKDVDSKWFDRCALWGNI